MYNLFFFDELKKWLRDPMTRFMLFYPILFGIVGRYVLPVIADNSGFSIDRNADFILSALTLMMPMIYGAVIGFSILDDRDDHIVDSIRVTPLSFNHFMAFRLVIVYFFAFLASVFVMWFSAVGNLSWGNILVVSFLASFSAPITGLLINIFANNKIEGFAIMKLIGLVIILPIIALFFSDSKELFFSLIPAFWPAKMIGTLIRGEEQMFMSFRLYFWIGLIYLLVINFLSYRKFNQRVSG
ncbi:MAG: ABC transporter permease [Bacillota bacterium]|nr:ABC transporter permease [Bacillota bacterium]